MNAPCASVSCSACPARIDFSKFINESPPDEMCVVTLLDFLEKELKKRKARFVDVVNAHF